MNKKISRLLKARKALSPVIATVILVAVTIIVAVSVAFWMGSIAGTYTAFEQVEITSAPVYQIPANTTNNWQAGSWPNALPFCQAGAYVWTDKGWNITLTLKNTGSADATIDNILINQKPYDVYDHVTVKGEDTAWRYKGDGGGTLEIAIGSGTTKVVVISIMNGADTGGGVTFSPGSTVDIKLHSGSGQEYPRIVTIN